MTNKTVTVPFWSSVSWVGLVLSAFATVILIVAVFGGVDSVARKSLPLMHEALGSVGAGAWLILSIIGMVLSIVAIFKRKKWLDVLFMQALVSPLLAGSGIALLAVVTGYDGGAIGIGATRFVWNEFGVSSKWLGGIGMFMLSLSTLITHDWLTRSCRWLINHVPASEKQGDQPVYAPIPDAYVPEIEPEVESHQQSYSGDGVTVPRGTGVTVKLGDSEDGQAINWYPNDTSSVFNAHFGVMGASGTGKTVFVKGGLYQLTNEEATKANGARIPVLVFDYKSDYVDDTFISATGAKVLKIYKLPYNPLALYGDMPMLPVHVAKGFTETMARAYGLGKKQQMRLQEAVMEAYQSAGISPDRESTWNNTAPTIQDVWEVYAKGEVPPEQDSLYAALSTLISFKIFEDMPDKTQSLYDMIDGVIIIRLDGYPPEVQNLVVGLTLDLFYSQMQKAGKPKVNGSFRQITKMILVDEADNFMRQDFPALRKILKEAREYGVGVMLSTQDITHFRTSENNYAENIMTWVVHRVNKVSKGDIESIFNISGNQEQVNLMTKIRNLKIHKSIFSGAGFSELEMNDLPFFKIVKG